MEIVKGNDIKVVWAITKTVDNVNIPEDLSTATNIRFKVWCSGTLISVPDYSVSGNEITFTIKGSVQRTGEYSFEVSYSKGYDARVVYKDAFLVVDLACQANYVKPDDIQVTTLQFYSSISSLYLWQLLDVKKSTTDNSVDKTFDKFYLGYDAKLKQWYGMKIPEETFKLEDMWKALDAKNEIIPKSHLDLTGLATQEWVKQQIDNILTGGGDGDVDINVVTQLVKDIIGKWFKEDENSDLYVVNKIVDGAEVGRNFYTYGGITAMGKSDGGGGGGGGGGMDEALLWSILGDGDNPDKQIAVSHLTKALSPYSTTSQMNTAISKAVKDYIPLSQKGRAGGVVPLDNNGLISSMYLPSYVDDVLEYSTFSALPATGESGKIYVTLDTTLTYRWSGTSYVEISKSLALGETADTAYAGNKGKENRDSINRLKNATFWGATYHANGNVYGTFNGTEIYLTNKIETPKIKIGDIFLEYDVERNAIKGVKYNSDGAEEMANFYMTGGITALGISSSGGISFTLQELADTNISNPQDKQALVYDAASQKWINGQAIGGGDISLNGTVYKPVNGIITLPGLYEKVSGGTASQFLKADGSVDNNIYALSYYGDQQTIYKARHLTVVDRRNENVIPSTLLANSISSYFTIQDTPYANWRSTIHVKGWSSDYATWELTGPSHNNNTIKNERPYFRYGFNTNWEPWRAIAFLDDVKNVANIYFNGQNIYSDYGHWVVGLIRIGTADIGDKYISGEMIYRRSNGIYGNGSVRFNLIKKYQTTSMFAGVLYVGYGIDTNQNAPRLCTFTYQGVKWGGLCWRSDASLNSIKTIIYDNSSTDTPFYVRYYNSKSGEVQNTEINNSISVLGSDIDIFPISSNGKFYTSSGRMDIHSAGNDWAYMRYTTDGRFYDIGLSSSKNSGSVMNGETGNFEIRPNGSSSNGIFVRYSNSSYGRLGVVSRSTQECSISYWNNASTSKYPLWTVGAGIRNQYSFDWCYQNQGYRATLDSEGKLFVNVRVAGNPYCSLTIGDYDTGLSWVSEGVIGFRSNAKDVGFWGYTNGRLYNCYFREPSGNSYDVATLMINGNGSDISPSIGFHQPGVVGCNLRVDNSGNFLFEDASNYKNVYAYNFVAAGWLYSTANNCEVRIGSQNAFYVHITNNKSRPYYMDNRLDILGHIIPYSASSYDLGEPDKPWRQAYINNMHGSADAAGMLNIAYIGGQQLNPQTYFNNITGLKVAMTGIYTNGAYWSDTLWINGYNGNDVPKCTALHFPRDGSAEMYISSQESTSTSYGALYRIWSSKNSNKSDAAWICSTLNASGKIYTDSYMQAMGGINCAGILNSGGASGFNVYATFHGNGDHGGIEIAASNNVFGIGVRSNDHMYWWWTNSGSVGSSSNKSYIMDYGGGTWQFTGSIGATGGITAMTSSDENLKNRLDYEVDYASKLLLLGKVFDFTYNDKALSRKDKYADRNVHTGLSWQKVRNILPTVCGMDKDGYGYINYISPDFISLIAGATQLNTLGIQSILNRTKSLEERVKILERRNEQLELKIKLIQR